MSRSGEKSGACEIRSPAEDAAGAAILPRMNNRKNRRKWTVAEKTSGFTPLHPSILCGRFFQNMMRGSIPPSQSGWRVPHRATEAMTPSVQSPHRNSVKAVPASTQRADAVLVETVRSPSHFHVEFGEAVLPTRRLPSQLTVRSSFQECLDRPPQRRAE